MSTNNSRNFSLGKICVKLASPKTKIYNKSPLHALKQISLFSKKGFLIWSFYSIKEAKEVLLLVNWG